jgi:hypothetical protein
VSSGPQVKRVAKRGKAKDTESSKGNAGEKVHFRQMVMQAVDRLRESDFTLQVHFLLSTYPARLNCDESVSGSHPGDGEVDQELKEVLESTMKVARKEVLYKSFKKLLEKV